MVISCAILKRTYCYYTHPIHNSNLETFLTTWQFLWLSGLRAISLHTSFSVCKYTYSLLVIWELPDELTAIRRMKQANSSYKWKYTHMIIMGTNREILSQKMGNFPVMLLDKKEHCRCLLIIYIVFVSATIW